MSNSQDVLSKGRGMSDGAVILGTVAIVGLVAVLTVALVYNRAMWLRGTSDGVEVKTSAGDALPSADERKFATEEH
ncbi:MAG: hypothetical protein AAFU85_33220 [Planctomycetota bacterium]